METSVQKQRIEYMIPVIEARTGHDVLSLREFTIDVIDRFTDGEDDDNVKTIDTYGKTLNEIILHIVHH